MPLSVWRLLPKYRRSPAPFVCKCLVQVMLLMNCPPPSSPPPALVACFSVLYASFKTGTLSMRSTCRTIAITFVLRPSYYCACCPARHACCALVCSAVEILHSIHTNKSHTTASVHSPIVLNQSYRLLMFTRYSRLLSREFCEDSA